MKKSKILELFNLEERIYAQFPGMRREATPNIVRLIDEASPGEGMIIFSQLDETNADEVIRQQIRHFQSIGQDFEWKVFDYDQPADMRERLRAHGFSIQDAEAFMVLDLEGTPEKLWQPHQHDVRRILHTDRLVDVQNVKQQVRDEEATWVFHILGNALSNYPDQMSVYVAYVNGQPASTAWVHFPTKSQFASLWGGATLTQFRGRGLFTALLAVRTQEARARGMKYLYVDASRMSRPILENHGFETIATTYPCKWKMER